MRFGPATPTFGKVTWQPALTPQVPKKRALSAQALPTDTDQGREEGDGDGIAL